MKKIRKKGLFFVLIAFFAGMLVGDGLVRRRAQVSVDQIRMESRIYRQEAERLAGALRAIRSAAMEATLIDPAGVDSLVREERPVS